LYIFGNSNCLIGSKKLELWVKVIDYLKENQFYGDNLPLSCQNHGEIVNIKEPEDFK
jgi:hypothetical protein